MSINEPMEIRSDGMYLQVLGSGSALPLLHRYPSSHVLRLRGKVFLIDCGEGIQRQLLRYKIPIADLHRIFITHLHGDHTLGLPGLMSTLALVGFKHPYHIYGPEGTEEFVRRVVHYICPSEVTELIVGHDITPSNLGEEVEVYSDRSVVVTAFALNHRQVPCIGYRFSETPLSPHLDRQAADFYGVPFTQYNNIKAGCDFVTESGEVIPSALLTKPNRPPCSFSFCSDTSFCPQIIPAISGSTLLYHEATFMEELAHMAHKRGHSTTKEAALIAKKAGVGALLLGHFSSRYKDDLALEKMREEAQGFFPNVFMAKEGLTLDLGSVTR